MARYLVVAHRSFGEQLADHLQRLHADDPNLAVYVVVPEHHPFGRSWTHPEVQIQARSALSSLCDSLNAMGISASGEVGSANPMIAARRPIRREGAEAFDGVVLATLPAGVSRLWRRHIPRRLERAYPDLEVTSVVADSRDAGQAA